MSISKKELAIHFKLYSANMSINYNRLRSKYFTDELLAKIGITVQEYKKIRVFNYPQSVIIRQHFNIPL